jgi:hypothetical protein
MLQMYSVKLYCALYIIKFTSKPTIDVNYKTVFITLKSNKIVITIVLSKDFVIIGIQPSFENCGVYFSEIFGM